MKIYNLIFALLLVFIVVDFCDDASPPPIEDTKYISADLNDAMIMDLAIIIEDASLGVELIFQGPESVYICIYDLVMIEEEIVVDLILIGEVEINRILSAPGKINHEGLFSKQVGKVFMS